MQADLSLTADERRALARLLDAHAPVNAAEVAHLASIRAFAGRHPDPFRRAVIEGHLTGSAFVIDPDLRLLLTHHLRLGIWIQLGGHAEGERFAEQVAFREAREESGLADLVFHDRLRFADGSPRLLDVDIHEIPARKTEPAHFHFDLRFLLVTAQPDAIRRDAAESHALEWVTLAEARARCQPDMSRAFGKIETLARRQ